MPKAREKIVLVGVLKNQRDLDILLNQHWYRIPLKNAPRLRADYLAFYQPAVFGRQGQCIQYYGPVLSYRILKRSDLLPQEKRSPKASHYYFKIRLAGLKKLKRPIKNLAPRRVFFGFTTLGRLLKAKDILQLYGVAPTEQTVGQALKQAGLKAKPQVYVLAGPKRYRLDWALVCQQGGVAIECDNRKAHASPKQKAKDQAKDSFLRQKGWVVVRLAENDIVFNLQECVVKIQKAVQRLGGLA